MKTDPLIIIGMHRSGTTMLTRLLEKLGLFTGWCKSHHWEAAFFEEINQWIFQQANASWASPDNLNFTDEFFTAQISRIVEKQLGGIRRIKYLGPKQFFNYSNIRKLDVPWGWKDPKNTFTLGVWKRLFPDAKILHLYRHPVDVAESLKIRERRFLDTFEISFAQKVKDSFMLRKRVFGDITFKLEDRNEGIALWEAYVQKAFSFEGQHGKDILHLKYEDLLEHPAQILAVIARFAKLPVRDEKINEAAGEIDATRRFAFAGNPDLVSLFQAIKVRPLIKRLGYDHIAKVPASLCSL